MAKISRNNLHDDVRERIKIIARQQMAAAGTAGISLRGIARELDVTAPALYRYYGSIDDLITALIVDAYNALADTLDAENARYPAGAYAERLFGVLMVYRAWALANPVDFQLIFGNPIPGYEAPRDVTIPAARRPFELIGMMLGEALAAGAMDYPAVYDALPDSIESYIGAMSAQEGYAIPPQVIYLTVSGWSRIHGLIMLELFTHTQPVIGDAEAFYRFEIVTFMEQLGLNPTAYP
jgi:AcrR family transcriptional regulator